ncbi:integrin beta-4 isoform X1 [Hippoglossus stenolepis]|uniref:integrin beta-4 isoform X1 n=1 Tax=Hippoglossus stenolepis TaxID=195615 RepID=UPI00159C226E|nr:integrin beta-4 isoform X1 [Hippoglossus stenolepis]XP_035001500.1 integrin beta-4 isoform X1 [Hippoglossus stenolepis]XP_035001501.1 integrin beta-4 isoform X1 [Hippoglossus stenolepis]XP_035001503.1 integrin beta-4 isoform X1 [Hippoglossus stenolepis]
MGRWVLYLSVGLGLLAILLTSCYAEENYCFKARDKSCSECLQAGKDCAYCPDENFDGPRCDLYENIRTHGCSGAALITAKSERIVMRAQQINMKHSQSQVSPQRMSMSFLPGEEKVVDVDVFSPTKGPLDLYILMDFSNSMADDLANLKKMGNELSRLIGNLSNDPTIGFGKFVDKVIEPQTDMRPSKLKTPWPDSDPPFSFQNVIKLTKDVNEFTSKLQKEKISGNLDAPEGGFDAILQAAVCGNRIGWRNHSTHLLVFSTESAFHYEADGANVLSGILPRNDERCHLDAVGKYTEDTKQDYPSIPTLVRVLGKHNIIPIFAVTNHSYTYYKKLQEYFPIAEVGLLQEDSSNILEVMETAFKNIRSKMSIHTEETPKAFKSQFMTTEGQLSEYGNFNFQPGEIGRFKMRLKAQRMIDETPVCQTNQEDKEGTMRVKPTTFNNAFSIEASILCPTCECEKTPVLKSAKCHSNGDMRCGKCQCFDGWLGAFCNCSVSSSAQDTSRCKIPGNTEPCSGRGECKQCGGCVCSNPDQFEGPYCQYDKTQCPRSGGFLCNDRGTCSMGSCVCGKGWSGKACECTNSNQTCLDNKGGICNGVAKCVCGRCQCNNTGVEMTSTCEPNFQAQLGVCEGTRDCVQCQAWKTGKKEDCKNCPFKITMVDELKEADKVLDSCSFRDEDDDCTYHYTAENPTDSKNGILDVQVLKKKDCPAASLLWLLPLLLFLLLLLALLLLCCWKYCACCKTCCQSCLALLPCCRKGRMVGFKEDEYLLRQSLLTSDHLDTPMVRTGPPKGTDVVRWKVTDNVHRGPNHPQALMKPNPKETIQFPLSVRLNRLFSEILSRPESKEADQLRKEAADNLNEVYKQIPGAQKVQKTAFRMQRNAGKRQDYTIMDTVLSAPRSSFPDIVKLTEKNVQSGNFQDLKVVPGYYTVATDREASGAIEFQEGVESVDVHVPLFVKEEDDDKKQLLVEAADVPLGIAEIGKRLVNITIIKEHATSVFSFLQPAYTYSRQDGVANIPISREIIEDGRTQVTYRSRDLTAKDKKDYITVEGDLTYVPGETQKTVPVRLLELVEKDGLLEDKQVKQFVMDLSNPRQGAKLGRYPRTTVTIADQPEPSVMMFKKGTQNFSTFDPTYTIPVVRTRNPDSPATVKWRTKKAQRFDLSGLLKFGPGETEKNIVIDPQNHPGPIQPETFHLELFDPSSNASIGERKTTLVNVTEEALLPSSPGIANMLQKNSAGTKGLPPGGLLLAPGNPEAKATGPRNIHLNWDPPPGNPMGYKVKYWIYGDPEKDAQVLDVKTPQAELTNLYPYCDYEMRVCAYNSMGEGYNTDMIACQTLEDVPGEPGRLAFNVISRTVTQVSWGEPAETNGNITAYEVIYTPIDDNLKPVGAAKKVKIDNPKKRMLLIENLQSAQTYQYKVRAKNSVGWGPFRDASINLASQPTRPLSIPIIPDIPIVDAEAGDEYDGYLMYSNEVMKSPGGSKTPSVSGDDFGMNGKWDQNFLFPGGSATRNLSASSSPMSTLSSNYRAGGGSFTTDTSTTYMSGAGGSRRMDMIGGGVHTSEVIMRKRSESRGYAEENIRDSIVMGDVSGKFPDLGGFGYTGMQSSSQSQFSYSLPQVSRSRTQSSDVNEALYSLDRVLQDQRLSPGVPDTPSRLVFSALGPTALKVSWQEPHCEKELLGYCVLYQLISGGDAKRINVTNPAENSVIIQDLLPNHSYLFKVKAQSQEGWGQEREGVITIESAVDPKSPLSPMPGSPFTLSTPSAPGPLVFTALSPDSLQLSWEKPRKPNGDILGYVVTCEQLHGGSDTRSFQVNGDSAETSLTVPNLTENIPYKFKVQARTTQGFGPEREGIITIESQDGGALSQYSNQSMSMREVFQMPTEVSTRTNISHIDNNQSMSMREGFQMPTEVSTRTNISHIDNNQSMSMREVFQMPTEVSTRTNISHTMVDDPYFSEGMMMTTQHSETSGMVTRQITKEVVERGFIGGTTVTKKMFYES